MVKNTHNISYKFPSGFFPIYGYMPKLIGYRFRVQRLQLFEKDEIKI